MRPAVLSWKTLRWGLVIEVEGFEESLEVLRRVGALLKELPVEIHTEQMEFDQ